MWKKSLIEIRYTENEIEEKRSSLRKEFIKLSSNISNGKINLIGKEDLEILFDLYDKYFFYNFFKNNFRGSIIFSLSKKMSKSAGKTISLRNNFVLSEVEQRYEIRVGVNFLFQYYELKREKIVGGIKTKDSLHALLIILEHELIHFLEFYVFGKSSCKGVRFKELAKNIFGHREVYHSLPTASEITGSNFGFNVGDKVSLIYKNKINHGYIYRINKRATVMILSKTGNYIDNKGNRYEKLYIPLESLNKA